MPFVSVQFFLFFPLVFIVYLLGRNNWRWVILLIASLIFYAALGNPQLLVILALVTLNTYAFGRWLGKASDKRRRVIFWVGLITNILILLVVKYAPFLIVNFNLVLQGLGFSPLLKVPVEIASIGVSFYVFQALAYLINVYLEINEPEKHFGYFALYQSFFPKLLQGPIERPEALLPQLRQPFAFNYENARSGALIFAGGLFKKIVLADRLGFAVNTIYGNLTSYSGVELAFATILYSLQLFFDFSGYTDMALGAARMFNIRLTDNFNHPYLANSIPEFWRRWHISFSKWIFDYIFKPLQMSLRNLKQWGTVLALIVTFLISGIWHGAQWTFITWGLIHGAYMAIAALVAPLEKKFNKRFKAAKSPILRPFQVFFTFCLVSFAWIFFRSANLPEAWFVVNRISNWLSTIIRIFLKGFIINPLRGQADLPGFFNTLPNHFQLQSAIDTIFPEDWNIIICALIFYLVASFLGPKLRFFTKPIWFRWSAYYLIIGMIIYSLWRNLVIYADIYKDLQFLYFRF